MTVVKHREDAVIVGIVCCLSEGQTIQLGIELTVTVEVFGGGVTAGGVEVEVTVVVTETGIHQVCHKI